MSKLKVILHELKIRLRKNPRYLWSWFFDKISEKYLEWKFGISTSKRFTLPELGIDFPGGYQYQPISYADFRHLMKLIPIRPQCEVFLDYGSGMGRALCLAATYPFRKVMGVEISPELNAIAEKNINRIRHKLFCDDIQIITGDATTFAMPGDVTIVYFFTPFGNDILYKVLDNIAESLRASPRQMQFIYCRSVAYPDLQKPMMNCKWLTQKLETFLPTGRVGAIYANNMWTGE